MARRAKQLTGQYVAALGGPDAIDPVTLAKIRRAAELVCLAEWHRTEALKGGGILLDDLVRLERLVDITTKRLGLDRKREPAPTMSLQEYARSKARSEGDPP